MTNENEWARGKVALVTGASSGIGQATALALGRAGADVAVHYKSRLAGAEAACRGVASAGGRSVAIRADVGSTEEIDRMFAELDAAFGGRLDILVNNAGDWMDRMPILECPESQWDRMFDVNAKSVFVCCKHAAERMVPQGSGQIVNIGSIVGHTGGSGGTLPYAAAKAAVHTFTRGLAKELAPHGIRVNAVAPGFADTPMLEGRVSHERAREITPLGRMARPEEVASVIATLLSPACAFMTGQILDVNGGMLMR
ncbi:MAG: 3-oxoacyl-ACP reductase FabG [Phycisphaerae bacterium]|nr:3-oxoacyl-ACP reductase FabG [Phycisphaerae bacterium]